MTPNLMIPKLRVVMLGTDLECRGHVDHHQHVGHGDHPLVGPSLECQQHIVTHVSAKGPEAKDGHTKVAQPCSGNRQSWEVVRKQL
mgnify:CR=1 FL=1